MVKLCLNNTVLGLMLAVMVSTPVVAQDSFPAALVKMDVVWQSVVSGLRAKTAQTAATGNQIASTALKSAEANASAITQFNGRYGVTDANNKYTMGRDQTRAACGPIKLREMANTVVKRNNELGSLIADADQEFMANNGDAQKVLSTLSRRRSAFYCSQEEFDAGLCLSLAGVGYNTGAPAGDTNASIFLNGGASGAEEVAIGLDFIDRVAPLPTVIHKSGVASVISRIIAYRKGADRSMAREIISGSILEGLQ